MGAADEIRAAIEKMERLGKGCLPEWQHCYSVAGTDGDSSIRSARAGEVIADLVEPHHADLIEVLHRTIDAQLAILRGVLTRPSVTLDMREYDVDALALARAINGTV